VFVKLFARFGPMAIHPAFFFAVCNAHVMDEMKERREG
jgi:hypothetical protein